MEVSAHPQIPLYRETPHGQIVDALITFDSASSSGQQSMQVRKFNMRTFKDGDTNQVQLIALAPQCRMDLSSKIATDPGPLEIFTPTTNLYIRGRGFYCNQGSRLLIISNDVETSIVKSLLKAPLLSGGHSSNAAEQRVLIYADYCHFDSLSNIVDYVGHVRVFDPQGDSSSKSMRVFLTTNNAVREIHWRDDVAINITNRGQAFGQSAFYVVTNGGEQVRLLGDAVWSNGLEVAKAGRFDYDSLPHTLHATNHVRVRWPNPPRAPTVAEMFSDAAFLQWPPTNGPIQEMTADGNVLLVNQSDESWATGRHAYYSRSNSIFQLTGDPVWQSERTNNLIKVNGDLLTVGISNRLYHAVGHAQFFTREAANSNRSLVIDCDRLDYRTNLAEFHDHVLARAYDKGALQDTLTSQLLTVDIISNKIKSAVATGDVRGETAPDAAGARKTLRCDTLTAHRNIDTGFMENIVAQDNVVIEEFGGPKKPGLDTLHADQVTAYFSPVTNRIQSAVADQNVEMDQRKNGKTLHATSDHAVYLAGTNAQVTLTGDPAAQTDKYLVSDANTLLWWPATNIFRAVGGYKITPVASANPKPKTKSKPKPAPASPGQ